jgi:hypothetical protein
LLLFQTASLLQRAAIVPAVREFCDIVEHIVAGYLRDDNYSYLHHPVNTKLVGRQLTHAR